MCNGNLQTPTIYKETTIFIGKQTLDEYFHQVLHQHHTSSDFVENFFSQTSITIILFCILCNNGFEIKTGAT